MTEAWNISATRGQFNASEIPALERLLHLRHLRGVLHQDVAHLDRDAGRDGAAHVQRLQRALNAVVDGLRLIAALALHHDAVRRAERERGRDAEPEAPLPPDRLSRPTRVRRRTW